MKTTPAVRTAAIRRDIYAKCEKQAKALNQKPGRVINFLLAKAFNEAANQLPIPKGTILP